jgi:hypothetical protein
VSDQRDPQPLARDAGSSIPYSPGLRVGDTIHVSGTIGRPHGGDLTESVSLDGVMQGLGGPDEDRGGFERGGCQGSAAVGVAARRGHGLRVER